GVAPPRVRLPGGVASVAGRVGEAALLAVPGRPFLPFHEAIEMIRHGRHYDCSKAQTQLNLGSRPLEATITDSLAWFRANGYLGKR
ncbi:MAG TPA: hypothetical protein VFX76_02905, partial [Roseiflexaceae bacterium]|nr:hypothetical protein [Roseiflexaceae bacterium]